MLRLSLRPSALLFLLLLKLALLLPDLLFRKPRAPDLWFNACNFSSLSLSLLFAVALLVPLVLLAVLDPSEPRNPRLIVLFLPETRAVPATLYAPTPNSDVPARVATVAASFVAAADEDNDDDNDGGAFTLFPFGSSPFCVVALSVTDGA